MEQFSEISIFGESCGLSTIFLTNILKEGCAVVIAPYLKASKGDFKWETQKAECVIPAAGG